MKKGSNVILFTIILASLLLMGQTGCASIPTQTSTQTTTQIGQTAQTTSSSTQGLDFSLLPGVGFLSNGATVNQGDSFQVVVHIENSDPIPKSGTVCLRDDIDDSYGGIGSSGDGECHTFSLNAADSTMDQTGKVTITASKKQDVYFPSDSDFYSYHGFPVTQQANLYATLRYVQISNISTDKNGLRVPVPQTETLSLIQNPAPVSVSIDKSVSSKPDNYNVDLRVTVKNQIANSEIWTPDFKTRGLLFQAKIDNSDLACETQANIITMESNQKQFKCSALVSKEQLTHVLTASLGYGVKLTKSFSYTIQKGGLTA